ncbi:MAG: ATP-dependent DNA helicase [Nitrospinota bacterium]
MSDIKNIFEPGGELSKSLGDYEYRPQQGEMAEAVAKSISSGQQLVVEAGTGTGKTLAYLVPAILSGRQVAVSTGTKNLQEQIFFKDVPFLRKHLRKHMDNDFTAVMLKGRSNYLCNLRLKRFAQAPLFKERKSEARLWEMICEWAQKTETGDRAELTDLPDNSLVWSQVCSNSDFCGAQKCPRQTDCHVARLRKEAEKAQILVVNHHLFFADLAIRAKRGGGVLPLYDCVIFDEAHLVEEIASTYFGFSISNYRIEELVRDSVREIDGQKRHDGKELIRDLDNLESRARNFFHPFKNIKERRFSLNEVEPDKEAGEILMASLSALYEKIAAIEPLPDTSRAIARRFLGMGEELGRILKREDEDYIFWGETRGGGVFLNASSLDVAPLLKETLYSERLAIFTSATLASSEEFNYICARLGIEDATTLLLPSPFDYKNQAAIYLPQMPAPDGADFLDALSTEAKRVIALVSGRTLFLFTSFRNMWEIRKRLEDALPYNILMQGEAPRHVLLDRFKEDVDSVLFATSSFWHGIDVQGEALSCVIIDRLPFTSPGDPIMSARIDRIKKKGGNAFVDYQLPEAVLLLKQGLGRLIRHRNDRGIMMIADSRLKTKGYGKTFLASLPPAPVTNSFDALEWR